MNNNKKTLVILTPGFAKDEADTTCLPMQQQMIRSLKENSGVNIIILSFQYPYHTKNYTWHDIKVIPFNGRNKGGIPRLLLRKKLTTTLTKIHSETPIGGLLSFWYGECAAVGKTFADKYKVKHFCWILGQDAKKENKYPKRVQLVSSELVALSDFIQAEFEKNHGRRPRHMLPVGIDTKQYSTVETKKNIDILGTGSLIPLKQYDVFLQVVAQIKKQIPGIKAVLIGKGPENDRLERLISQLGLQSNVTLTGELPYPEVIQWMQKTKLFLHPSSYEGFSAVCVEALYGGSHVISFCKTMNQQIEQWHSVSSKEEMIQKALTILEDPSTPYKRVTFCTIDEVAKKMIALFFKSI